MTNQIALFQHSYATLKFVYDFGSTAYRCVEVKGILVNVCRMGTAYFKVTLT